MSSDKAVEPESTPLSESGERIGGESKHNEATERKPYKKPELRKYAQIDYVTAYGVD